MRRRHDRTSSTASDRVAPPASRASTPWVSVAAGAGAVTLVVAVAGMVGAATGGGEAVVVADVEGGGAVVEAGVPAVTPRPDEPRPEVTRIPPPDERTDDAADDERPAPAPRPSSGATTGPDAEPTAPRGSGAAPSPTTPAAPTTEAPAPQPTDEAPAEEPDPVSVSWVQERLRAHGAGVEVTGTWDDATVAALRAFQQEHGLSGDGSVTAATAEALAAAPGSVGGAGESGPAEPTPTPSDDRTAGTSPRPTPSGSEPAGETTAPTS